MIKEPVLKIDHRTAFQTLTKIDFSNCPLSVCLATFAENDELPTFYRLQLTDDLTTEFRNSILKDVKKRQKNLEDGNISFRDYNAGSRQDTHEIECFDLENDKTISEQLASLKSLADLTIFEAEKEVVTNLRFYVMVAQLPNNKVAYFFRNYSAKKEIHRSKKFAAIFSRGHYDTVRSPLFLFDDGIDCIFYENRIFIYSQSKFQQIFRFFEELRKAAQEILLEIEQTIPIENFEAFSQSCESNVIKLAKLRNISSKPYFKSIKIDDLKKVIQKYTLSVKTIVIDGIEKLVYDHTDTDKFALLKLLDDDYLESIMTGQSYEVTGKRTHGVSES